jgi:hypothetical protein
LPQLVDNRLSVQLNQIRLLMQPQVQWEPVFASRSFRRRLVSPSVFNSWAVYVARWVVAEG